MFVAALTGNANGAAADPADRENFSSNDGGSHSARVQLDFFTEADAFRDGVLLADAMLARFQPSAS